MIWPLVTDWRQARECKERRQALLLGRVFTNNIVNIGITQHALLLYICWRFKVGDIIAEINVHERRMSVAYTDTGLLPSSSAKL